MDERRTALKSIPEFNALKLEVDKRRLFSGAREQDRDDEDPERGAAEQTVREGTRAQVWRKMPAPFRRGAGSRDKARRYCSRPKTTRIDGSSAPPASILSGSKCTTLRRHSQLSGTLVSRKNAHASATMLKVSATLASERSDRGIFCRMGKLRNGASFSQPRWMISKTPWMAPQIRKVQLAPCQKPLSVNVTSTAKTDVAAAALASPRAECKGSRA